MTLWDDHHFICEIYCLVPLHPEFLAFLSLCSPNIIYLPIDRSSSGFKRLFTQTLSPLDCELTGSEILLVLFTSSG